MKVISRSVLGVVIEKIEKSEGLRMCIGRFFEGLDFVVEEQKEKSPGADHHQTYE